MKWRGRRTSANIEDRRRGGGARAGGIGIVGLLIVMAVGLLFGVDISRLVGGATEETIIAQKSQLVFNLVESLNERGEMIATFPGLLESMDRLDVIIENELKRKRISY